MSPDRITTGSVRPGDVSPSSPSIPSSPSGQQGRYREKSLSTRDDGLDWLNGTNPPDGVSPSTTPRSHPTEREITKLTTNEANGPQYRCRGACGLSLPREAFGPKQDLTERPRSECLACARERRREYYRQNADRQTIQVREYERQHPEWHAARRKAQRERARLKRQEDPK